MSTATEMQMLTALEHLYYASKFQKNLFLLKLEGVRLEEMLSDLRVFLQAKIRILVLTDERIDPKQMHALEELGFPMVLGDQLEDHSIFQALEDGHFPVLQGDFDLDDVFALAQRLKPKKLFFLTRQPGLFRQGELLPFLTFQRIEEALQQGEDFGYPKDKLSQICQKAMQTGVEVAFVEGKAGNLFLETFTHQGQGTLLKQEIAEVIRPAEEKDVMDISLLMRPYVHSGQLLPIPLEEIAKDIRHFYVATINGELVAAARFKPFGKSFELSKLCTLPRYQGKGKARELCLRIFEEAKARGAEEIFALSVIEELGRFFQNMGLQPTDRRHLPAEWQRGYDFNRPSKAYSLKLHSSSK